MADPDAPAVAVQADVQADEYAGDSAYDQEFVSYTTALAASAVDYTYENGRRYNGFKEGAYIYPNDENESDRLDFTHKLLYVAMDYKHYWAPIDKPTRILDIGTGTGIWAMEIADQFPDAYVLGNDLSPIQPEWVPENVHFEVDDVEQPWGYEAPFDFIHSRCMGNAIKDWPKLVRQSFHSLKPGHYAEFVDFDLEFISPDGSLVDGSDLNRLNREFLETTRAANMEPSPGPQLERWMRDAGYVDIAAARRFLPIGTWPADAHLKEVGVRTLMMLVDWLESMLNYLYSRMLGMSDIERAATYAKIRTELRNPRVHSMFSLWIVYGRRPEAPK